jgi:hypothetical protein
MRTPPARRILLGTARNSLRTFLMRLSRYWARPRRGREMRYYAAMCDSELRLRDGSIFRATATPGHVATAIAVDGELRSDHTKGNEHADGNRSPIRWREIGEDHALAPTAELLQLSDHEYEPELKHAYRR